MENKIAPRIQIFVNQSNLLCLNSIVTLCNDLNIAQKCEAFGQQFELFVSAGSCDGENEKLYPIRMESGDLSKIPDYLTKHTISYMKKPSIKDVFGFSEKYLCTEFHDWNQSVYSKSKSPTFYIDSNLNAYPNLTSTHPWWKIGNLLTDGCETILKRYMEDDFFAAKEMKANNFENLLELYGNVNSYKLFEVDDYYYYIWNLYLREAFEKFS